MQRTSSDGTPSVPLADHNRALWRDLDALLNEVPPEGGPRRPPVFDALTDELPEPTWERLRVRAYGFDQDRQTRDKQWFTATTPPVLRYLRQREAAARARIGGLRVAAEATASVLASALKQAWAAWVPEGNGRKKVKSGPWVGRALAYYWPHAERVFWDHVEAATPKSTRALFAEIAFNAIDHAVGEQERQVRVARSMAVARRRVGGYAKGATT
jgi:CRISPR system Cascade subunit CasA